MGILPWMWQSIHGKTISSTRGWRNQFWQLLLLPALPPEFPFHVAIQLESDKSHQLQLRLRIKLDSTVSCVLHFNVPMLT